MKILFILTVFISSSSFAKARPFCAAILDRINFSRSKPYTLWRERGSLALNHDAVMIAAEQSLDEARGYLVKNFNLQSENVSVLTTGDLSSNIANAISQLSDIKQFNLRFLKNQPVEVYAEDLDWQSPPIMFSSNWPKIYEFTVSIQVAPDTPYLFAWGDGPITPNNLNVKIVTRVKGRIKTDRFYRSL